MAQKRARSGEKRRVARQRAARERRARVEQRRQALASGRSDTRRRRLGAYGMWAVAAVLAGADFFVYIGVWPVLSPSQGTVVLGLPAAALAIGGAILYGT